jgi:hypothetical protein
MLTQVNGPHPRHQRCHRPPSHARSHHGHSGVTGRAGVGVDARFTVGLDTDPQADPPYSLTAQVRPALAEPGRFQTHPHVWGVPPGAAHA